jgi:phosphoglycerate dehydrogenase-like enzyme
MDVRVAIGFGEDSVSTLKANVGAVEAAVKAAGGSVVDLEEANALVWLSLDGELLKKMLEIHPEVQWVQLPWAGVETFARNGVFTGSTLFTSAKGVFGGEVGEHAFFLALASLRNAVRMARSKTWEYVSPVAGGIEGKRVTVLGAGGIAERFLALAKAGGAETTVLRRLARPMTGADRTLNIEDLHAVLPTTDVLTLCLPLTPRTEGLIGEEELALMPVGSILVNVARGKIVDTDALVRVLEVGHLHAAGLDVTDPEPLPDDHRLWQMDNVLITSHSANADDYCNAQLLKRIEANVGHLSCGEPLEGVVDKDGGY